MRTIVIGCDDAAVDMKNIICQCLEAAGVEYEDVGCHSIKDQTAYPFIAKRVCEKIIGSKYEKRGILICGTGIGMCITANKFRGIRAAVAHDCFSAQRSILSNNGNVLCLGARVIGPELAKLIVTEWLPLEYVDGPSTPKVDAINQTEAENFGR